MIDKFHVIREYAKLLNHKNNFEHNNILKKVTGYFCAGSFEKIHELKLNLKLRADL